MGTITSLTLSNKQPKPFRISKKPIPLTSEYFISLRSIKVSFFHTISLASVNLSSCTKQWPSHTKKWSSIYHLLISWGNKCYGATCSRKKRQQNPPNPHASSNTIPSMFLVRAIDALNSPPLTRKENQAKHMT